MTLFVDCNNSYFSLVSIGNSNNDDNLFKRDREVFIDKFKDSNYSVVLFEDCPEIGNGFMIFKGSSGTEKASVSAHIRCTSQDSNISLNLTVNIPYCKSLLESVKQKAKRIFNVLGVNSDSIKGLKSISQKKFKKLIEQMDADLYLKKQMTCI